MNKFRKTFFARLMVQTVRNFRQMWPIQSFLLFQAASLCMALAIQGYMRYQYGDFRSAMVYLYGGFMGASDMPVLGYIEGGIKIFQLILLLFPILLILLAQGKYLEVALRSYCRMLVPRVGSLGIWWGSMVLGQLSAAVILTFFQLTLPVLMNFVIGKSLGSELPKWCTLWELLPRIGLCMVLRYMFALQLQSIIMISVSNPTAGIVFPAVLCCIVLIPVNSFWFFPMGSGILSGMYMGELSIASAMVGGTFWSAAMSLIGWLQIRKRDFLIAAI